MAFQSQTPHIVLLSISTAFTIPIGELAKHLVVRRGFTTTIITLADISNSHPQDHYLQSLPTNGISHETIPSLTFDNLSADASLEHRLAVTAELCAPFVATILTKLKINKRVSAFVADPASAFAVTGVAKQLGISAFLFFTSNLTAFSFCFHLPEIEEKMTCEYRHLTEPLSLPGCVEFDGTDFFHGAQDRSCDAYKALLRIYGGYKEVDGILINSFVALEPEPYKVLKDKENRGECPPIYAVGPFVPDDGWGDAESECLNWLDGQPEASVLYISFGTGGTLTREQTSELAFGLEKSGQRFVWVLRWATEKEGSGAFFDLNAGKDEVHRSLPDGFLDRTKGQGVIVPLWAPQVHILKHRAIGGFLNHCGWTSVLESIYFGVPMISWPLFVEQRVNAVLLSDAAGGVGVALRLKVEDNGVVTRNEVVNVVKELFRGVGGAKVRSRAEELKLAAGEELAAGGASDEALTNWCASVA